MSKQVGVGKVILIVLTILILGPLVFVGTCFPIAAGAGLITNGDAFLVTSMVLGVIIAIIVIVLVIKKIIKS